MCLLVHCSLYYYLLLWVQWTYLLEATGAHISPAASYKILFWGRLHSFLNNCIPEGHQVFYQFLSLLYCQLLHIKAVWAILYQVACLSIMVAVVWEYHKWPLTDLWLVDLIIKVLKKVKLDKQQKMLLSLRFILRYTVLKYMIVVVCAQGQPTTWSLPIVLHIGVLLFLK